MFWEVLEMFSTLILVRITQVYTFVKLQVVYLRWVHLFVCKSYLNKVGFKAIQKKSPRNQSESIPSNFLSQLLSAAFPHLHQQHATTGPYKQLSRTTLLLENGVFLCVSSTKSGFSKGGTTISLRPSQKHNYYVPFPLNQKKLFVKNK